MPALSRTTTRGTSARGKSLRSAIRSADVRVRSKGRASKPRAVANGSAGARAFTRRPCGYSSSIRFRCVGRPHEYPVGHDGLNPHASRSRRFRRPAAACCSRVKNRPRPLGLLWVLLVADRLGRPPVTVARRAWSGSGPGASGSNAFVPQAANPLRAARTVCGWRHRCPPMRGGDQPASDIRTISGRSRATAGRSVRRRVCRCVRWVSVSVMRSMKHSTHPRLRA